MTGRHSIGRWLVTIPTLAYGILPPIFDLSHTHVFHPDWPPHSRLHMVWLMSTNTALTGVVIWLLWLDPRRSRHRLAGVISLCVLGGFWVATAASPWYGGSLSDVGGVEPVVGMDRNALLFSVLLVMTIAGTLATPGNSARVSREPDPE